MLDHIAVAGFIVAVIGVVIAIPAAWAALRALKYAKTAPSARDLERVEGNTKRTSEHLEVVVEELERVKRNTASTADHVEQLSNHFRQAFEREALIATAQRVSMKIYGQEDFRRPFPISLTLEDPSVDVTRIQLLNESGNVFGDVACARVGPSEFSATLEWDTVNRWFSGGTPVVTFDKMRLGVRVWMLIGGEEAYRQLSVILSKDDRTEYTKSIQTFIHSYTLDGKV